MSMLRNWFTGTMRAALVASMLVLAAAPAYAQVASASRNWSGYVASDSTYTGVGGSWVVPAVTSATQGVAADATWVGIGGVSSRDLIQAGTQAIVRGPSVSYQAWYETLPNAQRLIPLAVRAGDQVTVSLTEQTSNDWRLVFTNDTTGQQYTQDIEYASSRSSAEWIEEMPMAVTGQGSTYLPLDKFGSVTFKDAYAQAGDTRESLVAAGAEPITMNAAGHVALAQPSAIGTDAQSFSVSRTDASSAQAREASGVPVQVARVTRTIPGYPYVVRRASGRFYRQFSYVFPVSGTAGDGMTVHIYYAFVR